MSGSSISEPTKEGYDLCRQYVDKCKSIGPDVEWNSGLARYEVDVLARKHDDLPFIFIENEEPNWPKFILCEAYIQAYETKLRLERQQLERWDQAIKAHNNKRRENPQKEAGGKKAVKKRNAEQSSGGHPGSKKRSTTRRRRRRSSNARKARKSRTTHRK
jgi:hypothetical protein